MPETPKTPRRKPARLERSGALTARDRMWAMMRAANRFSIAEIMVLCASSRAAGADITLLQESTVAAYCQGLDAAGYITRQPVDHALSAGHRCMRVYYLVRDVGVNAPQVDSRGEATGSRDAARTQMWNAMRILKGDFDRRDVVAAASTEACVVSDEAAKFFCAHLERAGYLVATSKGTRHVFNRYRFARAMNSGPRAPIIGRDLSVMDGNTGKILCEGRAK